MKKPLIALIAASVVVLSLCSCSGNIPEEKTEAKNERSEVQDQGGDADLDASVSVDGMTVNYPSDWSIRGEPSDRPLYIDMDNGGMVMLDAAAEIHVDTETTVADHLDSYFEGFDSSEFKSDTRQTWHVSGADAAEMAHFEGLGYEGLILCCITGSQLNSLMIGVPENDYDAYENTITHVMSSVSVAPMPGSNQETATTNDTEAKVEGPSTHAPEGTSLVGSDIPAGTYKLTASSSYGGYWEVRNSAEPDAEIVGNENFDGSSYVTVSDGQYLTLSRCTGQLQ